LFDIGESLAAARRGRGLELTDVEALTRIRAKQLAAIEAERWDELPGRAYARAFLRSYASCLDLEADLYIAEFEARFPAEDEPEPVLGPPRRRRTPGVPVRTFAVLAAAGLVVGIVAWNGGDSHSVQRDLAPPPAAHAAPSPTAKARRTHRPAAPTVDRRLVVRATRGNCWLLVRRGGPTGPVLYEGTLTHGSIARFATPRVWIRLGAPLNVDIHRGTWRARNLPRDPTNVVG
jgi:hypothetical protein